MVHCCAKTVAQQRSRLDVRVVIVLGITVYAWLSRKGVLLRIMPCWYNDRSWRREKAGLESCGDPSDKIAGWYALSCW